MFFTVLCIQLHAQLGIRGGVNLATINTNDESINLNNNLGYHLGLVYDLSIGNNLIIRPGILYTLKGTKAEFDGANSTTRTNYFEIPLDIHFKFGDPDDNRLGLYAGPYVALLLSADQDNADISDIYRGSDFGFNAGVTYDIFLVTVGLNYGAGVSNISQNALLDDLEIRNQSISLFSILSF